MDENDYEYSVNNMNSKKILIILSDLPAVDVHAGASRNFFIARSLAKEYKVHIIVGQKAENRDLGKLSEYGIEVSFYDKGNPRQYRHIFKRNSYLAIIFDYWFTAGDHIDAFRKYTDAKIIIDSHNIKFVERQRTGLSYDALNIEKQKELAVYRKTDLLITVTEYEQKILEKLVKTRIETVSTGTEIPSYIRGFKGRTNILYVGYMRNYQNEDAVVSFCREVFPYIKRELPGIKLYIVGNAPTEEVQKLNGNDIIVKGHVMDVTVYFSSFLASVAPLKIGSGMKSKIIESLAWGCPVVSTSVGVEGMELTPDKEVLIADTDEEFTESIVKLYNNEKEWLYFSENGYKAVSKKYSLKTMEDRVLSIFREFG